MTARRETTTLLRLRSSLMTLNSSSPSNGEVSPDRTRIDQRTGQERANAVHHDGQTALDLAGHHAGDDRALVQRNVELVPYSEFFARSRELWWHRSRLRTSIATVTKSPA